MHALLTAEEHVGDDFVLILGNHLSRTNLRDVIRRQRGDHADAAFLVKRVPYGEASRYGVCDTDEDGEVTVVVEKPADPSSDLVTTGFYTFSPTTFHARHLVQVSNRGEKSVRRSTCRYRVSEPSMQSG